ncbi:hypothetical protein FM104_11135 [Microbacterium esteraromaticum]|uniref:Uncharacterized protein n=1 Tax=Microbacterium esteraromaticum TaxID=57043 RepID=A0A1R4K9Q8_9MICO|nr:hypothetical protein FM104_11135 [Microbacterium esteraromaticum]
MGGGFTGIHSFRRSELLCLLGYLVIDQRLRTATLRARRDNAVKSASAPRAPGHGQADAESGE